MRRATTCTPTEYDCCQLLVQPCNTTWGTPDAIVQGTCGVNRSHLNLVALLFCAWLRIAERRARMCSIRLQIFRGGKVFIRANFRNPADHPDGRTSRHIPTVISSLLIGVMVSTIVLACVPAYLQFFAYHTSFPWQKNEIKMRQRQLEAFGQTDCVAMCTVEGMLEAHGTGGSTTGDITPTHMCELLKEVSAPPAKSAARINTSNTTHEHRIHYMMEAKSLALFLL